MHPFIPKLKRFISKHKPKIIKKNGKKIKKSNSSGEVTGANERFDDRNNVTFDDYKESRNRWGVEAMFAANAKLTGRTYDYDGNPHAFGNSHPQYVKYSGIKPVSEQHYHADLSQLSEASKQFRLQMPSIIQQGKVVEIILHHSFTHSLTRLLTLTHSYSLTYLLTRSLTYSLTYLLESSC